MFEKHKSGKNVEKNSLHYPGTALPNKSGEGGLKVPSPPTDVVLDSSIFWLRRRAEVLKSFPGAAHKTSMGEPQG